MYGVRERKEDVAEEKTMTRNRNKGGWSSIFYEGECPNGTKRKEEREYVDES